MTAPLIERVPVADLEAMWERELPCEGVAHLDIPPCGASAEWVLAFSHQCPTKPKIPAQFKCTKCHNRLMAVLERILAVRGYIECAYCLDTFSAVGDWVRYRKI
jgi:DNA-directed RNA polymerase subunit RPC12/RpoP